MFKCCSNLDSAVGRRQRGTGGVEGRNPAPESGRVLENASGAELPPFVEVDFRYPRRDQRLPEVNVLRLRPAGRCKGPRRQNQAVRRKGLTQTVREVTSLLDIGLEHKSVIFSPAQPLLQGLTGGQVVRL